MIDYDKYHPFLRDYLIKKSSFDVDTTILALRELGRFLYMSSILDQKSAMPLIEAVDDLWHLLLIQTRIYREICADFPTKRYIEHQSFMEFHEGKSDEDRLKLLAFTSQYLTFFGNFDKESAQLWTIPSILLARGWDIDRVNKCLTDFLEKDKIQEVCNF